MKFSTVVIIILIAVIAYVVVKDQQGSGNSKETQDQIQQGDGQTKQTGAAPDGTPGSKPGDPSWMWQSNQNPLNRGAYHLR